MELYFNLIFGCRSPLVSACRPLALIAALLLLGTYLTASSVLAGDIDVIQSDRNAFHFRVTVDPSELSWATQPDSTRTAFTTVQVGVPYGAQPVLELTEGHGPEMLSGVTVPGGLSSKSYPLADLGKVRTVRGRQLVGVRLFPVQGNSLYREIEVKLAFQGGVSLEPSRPSDPAFDRIFAAVVANWEQFKTWPIGPGTAPKAVRVMAGPFAEAGPWVKISIDQTGLYRLNGSALSNADPSVVGVGSGSIQLFSGGGLELPVPNDSARPVLTELPIIVEDGGDGVFDQDDYILFFGESLNRQVFRADDDPVFVEHHFAHQNVYWLHVSGGSSGLRIGSEGGSAGGAVVSSHTAYLHAEQNNTLRRLNDGAITDYYSWYWSDEPSMSFYVSAPSAMPGENATVTLSGVVNYDYFDLAVNGIEAARGFCYSRECNFITEALVAGANQMDIELVPALQSPPYLNYLKLVYRAFNEPHDGRLDLTVGQFSGSQTLEVANDFGSAPVILNISDPHNPARVTSAAVDNDWITFNVTSDSTVFCRYYLAAVNAAFTPTAVTAGAPPDLYATDQQADLIVIAPAGLMGAMDEYLSYRRADGYSIKAVTVEDVMDNFAFGVYDPTAIRDFLKYAYETYPAPAPATVLLVGDGNYDYLNHTLTNLPNFVPPYLHDINTRTSDDDYVFFGSYGILDSDTSYSDSDRGFDMTIGRWPVRTAAEVQIITDKIIGYESATNFGIWRNSISFVADDEYAGGSTTEWIHTVQSEELSNEHTPRIYNRDKIYAWEYPFVGYYKPEVNDVIVKAFNEGRLIVNYVGHGNPDVWSHEAIFNRSADLPRLTNVDRLPLVFTASCAIGFFDDPTREGMAEDLLSLPGGGAIGIISAIRSVFSTPNAEFNQAVYDVLLQNDSLSMAEAMYAAKLARQYVGDIPLPYTNDRLFMFFGDPCGRLAVPRLNVEFTAAPDTMVALARTTVTGRVVDDQMNPWIADGILYVHVFDTQREKIHRVVNSSGTVVEEIAYTVAGPTIYRGSATISAGEFDFEFIPPLDIGYGGSGASISVYARFNDIDGAGLADSIAVSDSIVTLADSVGPDIQVAFVGRSNFVSGDYLGSNEQMQVTINDPSGINLTGAVGHGITLEIDHESESAVNLTSLFEAELDDYTTGSLVYPIEGLESGRHHFKLKAWDNANNSASFEFEAEILAEETLAIRDLLNYPNPMKESTRFSFYLTQSTEKFSLELFTLSGRKIKSFTRYSLDPGYYDDIEWYGRDADGSRVATQIYIYKATAYPADGGARAESIGKLVLIN